MCGEKAGRVKRMSRPSFTGELAHTYVGPRLFSLTLFVSAYQLRERIKVTSGARLRPMQGEWGVVGVVRMARDLPLRFLPTVDRAFRHPDLP
jgi:hypothetical protein